MDGLVALGVLVLLGVVIVGVVRWARGGAPYDDGTGSMYVPYVPESSDDRRLGPVDDGSAGGGDDGPAAGDGDSGGGDRSVWRP